MVHRRGENSRDRSEAVTCKLDAAPQRMVIDGRTSPPSAVPFMSCITATPQICILWPWTQARFKIFSAQIRPPRDIRAATSVQASMSDSQRRSASTNLGALGRCVVNSSCRDTTIICAVISSGRLIQTRLTARYACLLVLRIFDRVFSLDRHRGRPLCQDDPAC